MAGILFALISSWCVLRIHARHQDEWVEELKKGHVNKVEYFYEAAGVFIFAVIAEIIIGVVTIFLL